MEKWLALTGICSKKLADGGIIKAFADVVHHDDSNTDDKTSVISYTDGEKALEVALRYEEQQATASSIDVMFFFLKGKIL